MYKLYFISLIWYTINDYRIMVLIYNLIFMRKNFNEKVYLKEYFWKNFDDDKIRTIERFFIFWNMFEKEIFDKRFYIWYELSGDFWKKIRDIVDNILAFDEVGHLKSICSFFKDYFNNWHCIPWKWIGKQESIEEDRTFNESWKSYFQNYSSIWDNEDIGHAVHYLIYFTSRLRNNLFHWIKEVRDLVYQVDLFHYANRFLALCIKK